MVTFQQIDRGGEMREGEGEGGSEEGREIRKNISKHK